MKQILQHLKTGRLEIAEVSCPKVGKGQVLIQTKASLISAGTERMLVEFGKANLISKARQQPDKVKQVLDKIKTDGFLPRRRTRLLVSVWWMVSQHSLRRRHDSGNGWSAKTRTRR